MRRVAAAVPAADAARTTADPVADRSAAGATAGGGAGCIGRTADRAEQEHTDLRRGAALAAGAGLVGPAADAVADDLAAGAAADGRAGRIGRTADGTTEQRALLLRRTALAAQTGLVAVADEAAGTAVVVVRAYVCTASQAALLVGETGYVQRRTEPDR